LLSWSGLYSYAIDTRGRVGFLEPDLPYSGSIHPCLMKRAVIDVATSHPPYAPLLIPNSERPGPRVQSVQIGMVPRCTHLQVSFQQLFGKKAGKVSKSLNFLRCTPFKIPISYRPLHHSESFSTVSEPRLIVSGPWRKVMAPPVFDWNPPS
jgi:hypothetical protein